MQGLFSGVLANADEGLVRGVRIFDPWRLSGDFGPLPLCLQVRLDAPGDHGGQV